MIRFLITIILLVPNFVFSQDSKKDIEYQNIILQSIQILNEYEYNSILETEAHATRFEELFKDSTVFLINDIASEKDYAERIPIKEYLSRIRGKIQYFKTSLEINNFSKLDYNNDDVMLDVFVKKNFQAYSNEVYIEDEQENIVYADDMQLKFQLLYVKDEQKMYITDISLAEKKQGDLILLAPHTSYLFSWIKGKPKYEMRLNIDDRDIIVVNPEYFYSIYLEDNDEKKIKSADPNLISYFPKKITRSHKDKASENKILKLFFINPIVDLEASFGNFSVLNNKINLLQDESINANLIENKKRYTIDGKISINFIKLISNDLEIFPDLDRVKIFDVISLYLKCGIRYKEEFDYTTTIDYYKVSYEDVDADMATYQRTIEISNFEETQNILMNTIFWQIEPRFKINDYFSLSLAYGQSLAIDVESATFENNANANYSGYYEDLFGITIAENGVYNFGQANLSSTGNLVYNTDISTRMYDFTFIISHPKINYVNFQIGINHTQFQKNIFQKGLDNVSHESPELNTINNLVEFNSDHYLLKAGINLKL